MTVITISDLTLNLSDPTGQVTVTMDLVPPEGLSGFDITIIVDPAIATIDSAVFPTPFGLTAALPVPGGLRLRVADLTRQLEGGETDALLVILSLTKVRGGRVPISGIITRLDDDAGFPITATVIPGNILIQSSRSDYKLPLVNRFDDGSMKVHARFYQGEIESELEPDPDTDLVVSVIRYRRNLAIVKILADFNGLFPGATVTFVNENVDEDGNELDPPRLTLVVISLPTAFAMPDNVLRLRLNAVLRRDNARTAIPEQAALGPL